MRVLGFDVKKVDVLKIFKDYDREVIGKIIFEDFNEVGMYLVVFIFSICWKITRFLYVFKRKNIFLVILWELVLVFDDFLNEELLFRFYGLLKLIIKG